jgi:hypothetical protein
VLLNARKMNGKMSLCALLVLVPALVSARQLSENIIESKKSPWFCHDLACPKYKVTASTADFEVRDYSEGKP